MKLKLKRHFTTILVVENRIQSDGIGMWKYILFTYCMWKYDKYSVSLHLQWHPKPQVHLSVITDIKGVSKMTRAAQNEKSFNNAPRPSFEPVRTALCKLLSTKQKRTTNTNTLSETICRVSFLVNFIYSKTISVIWPRQWTNATNITTMTFV